MDQIMIRKEVNYGYGYITKVIIQLLIRPFLKITVTLPDKAYLTMRLTKLCSKRGKLWLRLHNQIYYYSINHSNIFTDRLLYHIIKRIWPCYRPHYTQNRSNLWLMSHNPNDYSINNSTGFKDNGFWPYYTAFLIILFSYYGENRGKL